MINMHIVVTALLAMMAVPAVSAEGSYSAGTCVGTECTAIGGSGVIYIGPDPPPGNPCRPTCADGTGYAICVGDININCGSGMENTTYVVVDGPDPPPGSPCRPHCMVFFNLP